MSLHYIFWHWPRPDVDLAVYAGKLVRFQEELENSMGGDLEGETASYRSAPPPWVPADATPFSDWYTMADSSKLDVLNASAVNEAVRPAHNELAALYGGGAGSLYDHKRGSAFDPAKVQYTYWFAKPPGMSYDDLFTLLAPVTDSPHTTLMRRRMVLGPSPEFCLASEALHELADPIAAQVLQMNRL